MLWGTSRQVRLWCPWARHLTGRPAFMWKTGDPEIATPKRVRTYCPKHSDTVIPRYSASPIAASLLRGIFYSESCFFYSAFFTNIVLQHLSLNYYSYL